jgi:hypothetical protein
MSLTTNFDFGTALQYIREGKKVGRERWAGSGAFVVLMPSLQLPPANSQEPGPRVNARTAKYLGEGIPMDSQPYFALGNSSGWWQPGWLPNTPELLADDWRVLE